MKCTLDINGGGKVISSEFNVASGRECSQKAYDVMLKDNGNREVTAVMYKTTDEAGKAPQDGSGSGIFTYSDGFVKGISLSGSTFSGGPAVK
jgi:hypothetical protein